MVWTDVNNGNNEENWPPRCFVSFKQLAIKWKPKKPQIPKTGNSFVTSVLKFELITLEIRHLFKFQLIIVNFQFF